MKFRRFGVQIVAHVALGQHEPDAYSAFELDQIQRSKLHGIQQAPASSPRVLLVINGQKITKIHFLEPKITKNCSKKNGN